MPRPRIRGNGRKVKIGVSLDPDLYAWIVQRTGPGLEFSSITHALERGVVALRERESNHTDPGATKDLSPEVPPARRGSAGRRG